MLDTETILIWNWISRNVKVIFILFFWAPHRVNEVLLQLKLTFWSGGKLLLTLLKLGVYCPDSRAECFLSTTFRIIWSWQSEALTWSVYHVTFECRRFSRWCLSTAKCVLRWAGDRVPAVFVWREELGLKKFESGLKWTGLVWLLSVDTWN